MAAILSLKLIFYYCNNKVDCYLGGAVLWVGVLRGGGVVRWLLSVFIALELIAFHMHFSCDNFL